MEATHRRGFASSARDPNKGSTSQLMGALPRPSNCPRLILRVLLVEVSALRRLSYEALFPGTHSAHFPASDSNPRRELPKLAKGPALQCVFGACCHGYPLLSKLCHIVPVCSGMLACRFRRVVAWAGVKGKSSRGC